MKKTWTLSRGMRQYGRCLHIQLDGEEKTVWAILEQSRRRNRYYFEYKASPIGRYYNNYYYYYGPADFDIRRLDESNTVTADGERFFFVQKDAVYFAGHLLYYRGVLKKWEDDDGMDE